jgi:DNA-binding protein H-NS
MPARSFKKMSMDALLELRDAVSRALSQRAAALKKELAAIGADYAEVGRIAIYGRKRGRPPGQGKHALAGRKVPPKYRGPKGETWAGRGATPLWLVGLMKQGHKREEYAIDKGGASAKRAAAKGKKRAVKRSRRKEK